MCVCVRACMRACVRVCVCVSNGCTQLCTVQYLGSVPSLDIHVPYLVMSASHYLLGIVLVLVRIQQRLCCGAHGSLHLMAFKDGWVHTNVYTKPERDLFWVDWSVGFHV